MSNIKDEVMLSEDRCIFVVPKNTVKIDVVARAYDEENIGELVQYSKSLNFKETMEAFKDTLDGYAGDVEVPDGMAPIMICVPENAVAVTLKCRKLANIDDKKYETQDVFLGPVELAGAKNDAEENYIGADDKFCLTDLGKQELQRMKQ